ncbi:hypothetical protein D3C76_1556760 [compost metagenome]
MQGNQPDIRVELLQPTLRYLRLWLGDVVGGEEDLALQITQMNLVIVGQHQSADPCTGQVQRRRGA